MEKTIPLQQQQKTETSVATSADPETSRRIIPLLVSPVKEIQTINQAFR
jgi:hypothetical protein